MKKHILIYALSALTVFGLGSCVKPVEETLPTGDGARTVTFTAELGGQTRTGLQMKFVPNWVNTDLANVHLFETVGVLTDEGDNVTMTIEEGTNNEVAHFTAQFGTETDLFVTPPTRADGDASYTAIVASRADGKYVVPATQTPDPVSLFDPNADFLVASGALVEETGTGKQVDLTFLRPVAVSRLAIMNIEGQSIKSVKITSTDKLTGSVAYEGIDFAAGTASFDAETGSEELTLSYGDGIAVDATSTFYAYFISLPGSKNITAVEVTTNRYVYTKTFGTGKTLTFNTTDFKNIAVDMSKVTPTQAQELSFGKETLSGMVGRRITPPALSGNQTTPTYASDNTNVATVDEGTGALTLVSPGTAVITATAPAGSGYGSGTASYTLTVVAAPQLDAHHYQKVTDLSGVTVDKHYIFVYDNGSSSKVFMPILNATQDAFLQTDNALDAVVVNGNVIAGNSEIDLYQIAFDNIGTGGKMAVSAMNAFGATPYYFMIFGLESTDNQQDINEFAGHPTDNGFRATFSVDENGVLSAARSDHYFVYQGGAFKHASSADADSKLALYEYVPGLVSQTLAFTPTTLTASVGRTVTPPTLSGAYTTVTYSSSAPSVVSVNENTGALSLNEEGTATITATAAAENGYASATASYTVTVNAAPPVTPHYYQKVTQASEIVADGQYLLVYENGASSKVFRPVRNGDVLLESNVQNALETAVYGNLILANDSLDDCQFTLTNQDGTNLKFSIVFPSLGCYFHPYNETNNFAADDDTGYRSTFTLSDGLVSIVAKGNRAVRYSTSNQWFLASSSDSDGVLPALYKYVEGAAPNVYVSVSTPSAGTYLILGRESNTNPAMYLCTFPPTGANQCAQLMISDDLDMTALVTTDEDIISNEVELIASGDNWLVKVKKNNQYMYFDGSAITFTNDATLAVQTINADCNMILSGSLGLYHSGSGGCFKYDSGKGYNLRLFKLNE